MGTTMFFYTFMIIYSFSGGLYLNWEFAKWGNAINNRIKTNEKIHSFELIKFILIGTMMFLISIFMIYYSGLSTYHFYKFISSFGTESTLESHYAWLFT